MNFHTILFDLDGTLTDPKLGITKSVQYSLRKFDIHVEDLDALIPFIGPPLGIPIRKSINSMRIKRTRRLRIIGNISKTQVSMKMMSIQAFITF